MGVADLLYRERTPIVEDEAAAPGAHLPLPARARRLVLTVILAVSALLQLYRLNELQTFSDDQALQMNVVHGMLVDHHLPLLGLALSVGHAHIGPLFYYLLALPMWLGQVLVGMLDPTAGVAMIGLFQVATVYLLYRLGRLVDAPWLGLCAAGLYATSGLVVYWSRFLWPNTAPFFVVLALYALIALARGRPRALVLLAGSLGAAAQMQPTAVLLIPVAILWLLVARPRVTRRHALLACGLVVLLFAPVIVYDLTHHFAETRAWLSYGTTVRPGAGSRNGLWRGLQEVERFGWRAVGFRTRAAVDALLVLAACAVLVAATGVAGRPRALLARLLVLWAGVYLLALSLYRGALHPHYVEPLYPLPFLAIGLLLDLAVVVPLRALATGAGAVRPSSWARGVARPALYAATGAVVIGLAAANVRHLFRDDFGLDAFQLDTPAEIQGNRVMLGEMRQAAGLIARGAAGHPYSFLVAVRDGAGGGFAYLQRHTSSPPALTLRPLQFLLVEPAGRLPTLWPRTTRLRWDRARGGFARLPHLLVWRIEQGTGGSATGAAWARGLDTGGPATAITADSGAGGRLIAGYPGGVAVSPDGDTWRAARWPRTTNGSALVTAIAASAACPRTLYAGTFDGVLVSRDGAASWRRAPAQPASTEVLALLPDRRRCGVVLAGTGAGIARSADGGNHWCMIRIGPGGGVAVHALAVSSDGRTLYAGTDDGVWISGDGGATWPAPRRAMWRRATPWPALALLAHPAGAPVILAGSETGLRYSGDGGATWAVGSHSLGGAVLALLDLDRHGTLLAGTDGGLYVSHDNGAWWDPVPALTGATVNGLARGTGQVIYAASSAGVYRSSDNAVTWTRMRGR